MFTPLPGEAIDGSSTRHIWLVSASFDPAAPNARSGGILTCEGGKQGSRWSVALSVIIRLGRSRLL
jgi:hypothetical protein